MFAGHVGAGLGLASADRRRNAAVLVLAALFADLLLWSLVLAGVEQARVPPDYGRKHYLTFEFPYSHGLAATVAWAALVGLLAAASLPGPRRARWGALAAAAVLSHAVLDLVVHVPEIPLLGAGSRELGLGLWRHMPLALGLEAAIAIGGLALYLRLAKLGRGRALGVAAVVLVVLALTVAGQTVAPAPPSGADAAVGGLVSIVIVVALLAWLARGSRTA